MANIFTNAKNFIKDTLKQAATTDNLRDFAHANRLFVGSDFRLVRKHEAMFHVFFDINPNPQLGNNQVSKDPNRIELGLMVKSVALPKYEIATKKLNSYIFFIFECHKKMYIIILVRIYTKLMHTVFTGAAIGRRGSKIRM